MREHLFTHISLPAVFLLEGDLGSGKTTFVRTFCELLGNSSVSSPTFSLHQIYDVPNQTGLVHHFDFYRLKDERELESIGFTEAMLDPSATIFIEWPQTWWGERSYWSKPVYRVRFKVISDQERDIFVDDQ